MLVSICDGCSLIADGINWNTENHTVMLNTCEYPTIYPQISWNFQHGSSRQSWSPVGIEVIYLDPEYIQQIE